MSVPQGESAGTSGEVARAASGTTGATTPDVTSASPPETSSAASRASQAYRIRTQQIAASQVHRGRQGRASALLYGSLRVLAAILIPLLVRLQIEGREHVPPQGAVLLASNHIASVDIPLVAFATPRVVHYMAKAELFQAPFAGFLIRRLGAFPVRRGESDREALRISERLLGEGKLVGIFPEGHRTEQHALIEAHPGVALIALRADVPVIPVAIWGSERALHGWSYLWRRPAVTIRFGPTLHVKATGSRRTTADVKQATDEIMGAIASMLPPSYRGIYAHLVSEPRPQLP